MDQIVRQIGDGFRLFLACCPGYPDIDITIVGQI
jgi:hypothetical protein